MLPEDEVDEDHLWNWNNHHVCMNVCMYPVHPLRTGYDTRSILKWGLNPEFSFSYIREPSLLFYLPITTVRRKVMDSCFFLEWSKTTARLSTTWTRMYILGNPTFPNMFPRARHVLNTFKLWTLCARLHLFVVYFLFAPVVLASIHRYENYSDIQVLMMVTETETFNVDFKFIINSPI